MSNDVLPGVQGVFEELFGVNPHSVSMETTSFDIPAWDSVGHLSLCAALEDAFEIGLTVDEMSEMYGVREIVSIIEQKKKAA